MLEGSITTTSYRVVQLILLMTPLDATTDASDFTAQWVYDNSAYVKTVFANLLGVDRDYVEVVVPSLTSSAEPFNVTVRYFDTDTSDADLVELLVCAFATCSADEDSVTMYQDGPHSASATLIAESSTDFATKLSAVVLADGGDAPSGWTNATSTLPSWIGVMDDLLAVGPFFGCSTTPQKANTLDTWTCPATSTGDSCAVECADGYDWPASGGAVCLTKDSYSEVLADCVHDGAETASKRVVEFHLLVTPQGTITDGFSALWTSANIVYVEMAVANLLDRSSDKVELIVPVLSSSSEPFNVTVRYLTIRILPLIWRISWSAHLRLVQMALRH